MAYQIAVTAVTLNNLKGHSPLADVFKCNPSNICAAFYTISTDSVLARFLCISEASCCLSDIYYDLCCWLTCRAGKLIGWCRRDRRRCRLCRRCGRVHHDDRRQIRFRRRRHVLRRLGGRQGARLRRLHGTKRPGRVCWGVARWL